MRILHTSDWHLGQHFLNRSREQEHKLFLEWLLKCIQEQQVDAVIVAGDIFDTGTPPSYARTLMNQFIVDLHALGGPQLVILGGNHDSVATLHESRSLYSCLNTHVIGAASKEPEQQVITLNDKNGKPGAIVCAVPYIRPRDVLMSYAGDSREQKERALQEAMAEHYRAVYDLAEKKATAHNLPVIATGHLTTVGGKLSDSERELYIGTLSAFPAEAFPAADYIALGHLHRAQKVGDQDHIRYSGSPIPLSFDECQSAKQVVLVDCEGGQLSKVTEIAIPRFRKMAHLHGTLDVIEGKLQALLAESWDSDLTTWVDILVSEQDWISELQPKVDAMIAGQPVEALKVQRDRQKTTAALRGEEKETLAELNINDVFARRLASAEVSSESSEKLSYLFQQVVASLADDLDEGHLSTDLENRRLKEYSFDIAAVNNKSTRQESTS